jgi:hypothetical protein
MIFFSDEIKNKNVDAIDEIVDTTSGPYPNLDTIFTALDTSAPV